MAEQKPEGSIFGSGPSSTSGSTPNLFGTSSGNASGSGANPSSRNLFSSASQQAGSLFGSTQPATGTSQSSAPSTTTTSQGGLFGSFGSGGGTTAAPLSGAFLSTPNKPAESSTDQSTKSTFGAGLGSNLFGSQSAATSSSAPQGSTTPAQNKPGGLFGNFSTTPAGPPPSSGTNTASIFGNMSKQDGKPLFGGLGQQPGSSTSATQNTQGQDGTNAQATGLFGGNTNPETAAPTTGAQSGSSPFGQAPGQPGQSEASKPQTSNLFGSQGTQNPASQSGSLFGNLGSTAPTTTGGQNNPSTTKSLFSSSSTGQTTDSSSNPTGQPSGTSLFGGASSSGPSAPAATAATSKPNLFSGSGMAASASGGLFPAAASQSSTSPAASTTTAAPTSSLFSNLGSKTAEPQPSSYAAPASNLFGSLGGQAKTTSAETLPITQSMSGATTAAPATSLFGGQQPTASSGASQPSLQAPANAKPDDASKGAGLGASTGGPKPTPASRLKNKSMDEIITRWASDLSKYQKEFQNQATQVAKWDQMLVENSDKIQKLYGHTLEAERATIEVERQLTAVENDQAELEYWLEHYENQVDELMSKQVGQSDSLSGPDQERERTYKLAEKLSDRLDEMNKDLTAMVDEINDASSNLSKTSKPDDPLSQIVRVLNGHLTQLQQIDQGTAALQAKVQAAQKTSRQIGPGGGRSGLGGDAADDFYRSYMGRR